MLSISDYGSNWTLWDPLFQARCSDANVPWQWLKTIAMIESSLGLDPRVARGIQCPTDIDGSTSEDGKSWGLLQLEPATARDFDMLVTPAKLNSPDYSIHVGARLLRRLYSALSQSEEFTIKAWNEGQGAAVLEKAGRIEGRSNPYWQKYLEHKALVPV